MKARCISRYIYLLMLHTQLSFTETRTYNLHRYVYLWRHHMAGPPSRITIAKPDIIKLFSDKKKTVYSERELATILEANRSFWRLTQRTTADQFINFLVDRAGLRLVQLESKGYR